MNFDLDQGEGPIQVYNSQMKELGSGRERTGPGHRASGNGARPLLSVQPSGAESWGNLRTATFMGG